MASKSMLCVKSQIMSFRSMPLPSISTVSQLVPIILPSLCWGWDRDSAIVAFDYDERDVGVKEMIRLSVEGCKRNKRHSGLCGQAPRTIRSYCRVPSSALIDSISLNPDAVLKTILHVLEIEKRLGGKQRDEKQAKISTEKAT